MPAPPWRGCHIWGQMCAWQMPNLHESPLVLPGWGWELLCNSPTEAGSRESKSPSAGPGCWVPFSSTCFQRAAKHLHHKPHQPLPSSLRPGAGLLCAVATQSLPPELEGGSSRAKALSCEGPFGAVRPQTEWLGLRKLSFQDPNKTGS